jgi:hypothetical protein
MHTALYYPFTGPERESLLKTSLFLWDTVDFIVPFTGFSPHAKDADSAEALEIIGRNYVPTEQDKKHLHEELQDLCNGPLSQALRFELERPELAIDFYPQKLLPETWEMLSESQLALIVKGSNNVRRASTGPLFGYYMMSLLAVCCSKGCKRLVTDQHDPYQALANILIDSPNQASQSAEDWHGRLIALTLKGPDFSRISLKKLVALRRKENQLLQHLRRIFIEKVDKAAMEITSNADNPNIVREVIDEFTNSIELDLRELKRCLRRSATSLLLSNEYRFSVLAGVTASVLGSVTGGLVSVGGLTKGLMEYQDRRRRILREHPSSWLFAAKEPLVPVY